MNKSAVERADVVIVGAGASGTLVAVQLMLQTPGPLRLILFDQASAFGRGVAYSTPSPEHRLNVPAGRMTGVPSDPEHFLRWLRNQHPTAQPTDFALRRDYGSYLRELLRESVRQAPAGSEVVLRAAEVTQLTPQAKAPGWRVLAKGRSVHARAVVLALGAPSSREGPWIDRDWARLDPAAPLLLVGTGLTLVDAALELTSRGHRGVLHAISRHGLLPRAHQAIPALTWTPHEGSQGPADLRRLVRELRGKVAEVEGAGGSWRSVIDSLRARTPELWMRLGLTGQRRFLRHLRSYWDVHRHRMAPQVATGIQALLTSGQLQIQAGRIRKIRPAPSPRGYREVQYTARGDTTSRWLRVARVVHCTGQGSSLEPAVVRGLVRQGWVQADALGIGFLAGPDQALGAGLYTLGPPLRGQLWESVAVPEIRVQAEAVARALLRRELLPAG